MHETRNIVKNLMGVFQNFPLFSRIIRIPRTMHLKIVPALSIFSAFSSHSWQCSEMIVECDPFQDYERGKWLVCRNNFETDRILSRTFYHTRNIWTPLIVGKSICFFVKRMVISLTYNVKLMSRDGSAILSYHTHKSK